MTVKISRETEMMLISIKLRNEIETIFYYISKYASENLDLSNRKGEVCVFYLHLKSGGYDFSEIIDILSGRYEVECTPEENLVAWVNDLRFAKEEYHSLKLETIIKTLDILGLEIVGVNE